LSCKDEDLYEPSTFFGNIIYKNEMFFSFGYYYNPNDPSLLNTEILTSENGTDWTVQQEIPDVDIYGMYYGNDNFLLRVNFPHRNYNLLSSKDLMNWNETNLEESRYTNPAFGNDIFVIIDRSKNPTIYSYTSSDGINWEKSEYGITDFTSSILSFGNGIFLVLIDWTSVLISEDGKNWTKIYITDYCDVHYDGMGFDFVNGEFVSFFNDCPSEAATVCPSLLRSSDGINWTYEENVQHLFNEVKYINNTYFGFHYKEGIYSSKDLSIWSKLDIPTYEDLSVRAWADIAFGNDTYVVSGRNRIIASTNLTDWTVVYEAENAE